MNSLLFLHNSISCVKHAQRLVEEKLDAESFIALRSMLSRFENNNKRIAVVGSFSSGKSTFVNSILALTGENAQAVGISETTAVPTVIRPSHSTCFKFWDEGMLNDASPSFIEAIMSLRADSVNGILQHYFEKEIEFVREIELDSVFHGTEYLDLPGLLGIAGRWHDKAIRAGVLGADGLVYMVNGRHGFQQSDMNFAEKEVPSGMPVLVVVTHLGDGSEDEDTQIITKISETACQAFGERFSGVCATIFDGDNALYTWEPKDFRKICKHEERSHRYIMWEECLRRAFECADKIEGSSEIPKEIKDTIRIAKGILMQDDIRKGFQSSNSDLTPALSKSGVDSVSTGASKDLPRESFSNGRFLREANTGVIEDKYTGLLWLVGPDQDTGWIKAKAWAEGLGDGWRMPTITELRALYNAGIMKYYWRPFENSGVCVWGDSSKDHRYYYLAFDDGISGYDHSSNDEDTRGFAVRLRS